MKKFLVGIVAFLLVLCLVDMCSNKQQSKSPSDETRESNNQHTSSLSAQQYAKSLIDPDIGIHNAAITDIGMLVIAVDAYPGANFDIFAKSYLESAVEAGVSVKGCLIVDIKDCEFQKGAVVGKRIGKAYNH